LDIRKGDVGFFFFDSVGGELQPMPDSRRIDDFIGSGELDKRRSLKGETVFLWLAMSREALGDDDDVMVKGKQLSLGRTRVHVMVQSPSAIGFAEKRIIEYVYI
jgi:hypothetical protein